jgi:hypothetical protein
MRSMLVAISWAALPCSRRAMAMSSTARATWLALARMEVMESPAR